MKPKTTCRVCGGKKLVRVLNLGETPLANDYPTTKDLQSPTEYYPLEVYRCATCTNVQLGTVVDPSKMFKTYLYASSVSWTFEKHFEKYAKGVAMQYGLKDNDLVVDIGSNDGILLKPFKKMGMKVVGVDPAENIAKIANRAGIPTIADFFTKRVAREIKKDFGTAKVITANNVFAHIDNLDEVVDGVKVLLAKDGVFVIEVQYLPTILENGYFDQIYHEHLNYWTIRSFLHFFKIRGLFVVDAQKVDSHGGSLRLFVSKTDGNGSGSEDLITERDFRIFGKTLMYNKVDLLDILTQFKELGEVCAYGAPAKITTLFHYFGIGPDLVDFVIDDSKLKQGRFVPGKRIPIYGPEELYKRNPAGVLIAAWNFAEPIMAKHPKFEGRFIIPCPIPRIA